MFYSLQIITIFLISYSNIVTSSRSNKHTMHSCPHGVHRHNNNNNLHQDYHSAMPYSVSDIAPPINNRFALEDDDESDEDDDDYDESMSRQVKNMDDTGLHDRTPSHDDSDSVELRPVHSEKENEVSEYFLKAYFPELNDFYPGTTMRGTKEYHITIQPNIKEIRNKLAKKIAQTSNDFKNAIQTIRTMLNEETIEAVTSLITLPSTEYQFIKNVIKILKVTMENIVVCVSRAGNRLMALPKRWSLSYQPCVVDEFKESWGITENVHHIFQNAVYYVKNFILKLESCFNHEETLVQWCVNDIFNDVPSYVTETVTKLNRELDGGITYLKAVPSRVESCEMDDNAEKKLLLPFMIIREMVKCVLTNAEL